MIKILSHKGFRIVRQRSSHVQMKDSKDRLVTIPIHTGKPVSVGVLLNILHGADISRDEFLELIKRR